ncbi:thioredoxin domain-containing protein [Thermodesulfobacteriota bacterium]
MSSTEKDKKRISNRLASQKSPYLLQHATNPVDWYPWGEEAFKKAQAENKPVFLSIGYATCHWCHVMAHESFEDEEVAEALNQAFIAIKVDREERPDIDKIYMSVCQAITGSGGWPLSVFMTPDARPFFAGTYFPKTSRAEIPGFLDILKAISDAWQKDRTRLLDAGENIVKALDEINVKKRGTDELSTETLEKGYSQLESSFDHRWGGFGGPPKFPTPHQLTFLLRWSKRRPDSKAEEMVSRTLNAMRNGGIFDQIGFGFHRYSVDEKWLVPHFEKMLYDQALLAIAYAEAYLFIGSDRFGDTAKEIFSYVLDDMTSPEGAFYSAEDADSEGREGLFYTWTHDEIEEILGKEKAVLFSKFFGIQKDGNFEGKLNIPNISRPLEEFTAAEKSVDAQVRKDLEESRRQLKAVREERPHPLKDDKILTSWNGLMIAALSKGSQIFGEDEYGQAAQKSADFILKYMRDKEGRLLRRFREGEAAYPAYLDDYAFMVWGLLELYEAIFDVTYLEEALKLSRIMIDIFWDEKSGGLFFTGKGNEPLITRTKDAYDGALPSGNSIASLNLLRLGRITGEPEFEERSEKILTAFSSEISTHPVAYTQLLSVIDFKTGPGIEVVIAGNPSHDEVQKMIRMVRAKTIPGKVLLVRRRGEEGERLASLAPFTKSMKQVEGKPTAYVCRNFSCMNPVADIGELKQILDQVK